MMRTLLIAALLTASTAHAESYICTTQKVAGLAYDSAEVTWVESNIVPIGEWEYIIQSGSNGNYILRALDNKWRDDCITTDTSKDEFVCATSDNLVRFNRDLEQFIKVSVGSTKKIMTETTPMVEAGLCKELVL